MKTDDWLIDYDNKGVKVSSNNLGKTILKKWYIIHISCRVKNRHYAYATHCMDCGLKIPEEILKKRNFLNELERL